MSTFLGKLIKDMREERMMSIEEMASISGVSAANLNDMELGESKIPLLLFIKLLRSFSTSSRLKSSEPCVSHAKDIDRFESTEDNMKYCPLALGPGARHMTPFILQIFDSDWSDTNADRGGEDFVYVLSGAIEIIHGDKKYHLLPGDSIYFDSSIPHAIKNLDSNYSKLLMVLY